MAASAQGRKQQETDKDTGLYRVSCQEGEVFRAETGGISHPEIGFFILGGGGQVQQLGQLEYSLVEPGSWRSSGKRPGWRGLCIKIGRRYSS